MKSVFEKRTRCFNLIGLISCGIVLSQYSAVSAAPTKLLAQTVASNQINLYWTDNVNETIKIDRKSGTGSWTTLSVTIPSGTKTYNNTNLARNTTYSYRVYHIAPTYSNTVTASTGPSYYLDVGAADGGSGTQASPWNNVSSINNFAFFNPGDKILIRRSTWVKGSLSPKGSGSSAGGPITIDSYANNTATDTAKPLIDALGVPLSSCIRLDNQSYWTIQNLVLSNTPSPPTQTNMSVRTGIFVTASTSTFISNIKILNNMICNIYGSNLSTQIAGCEGIFVTANINGKMDNIIIQNNKLSNILGWGIFVQGQNYNLAPINWNILSTNVLIHGNSIIKTAGNGIIVCGVDNPIIEYNLVDSIGWVTPGQAQGDAEQTTCCKKGLIQYNEVCHSSVLAGDANGLHYDQGAEDTIIFQYNYSHDNGGSFFAEDWPSKYDPCNDPINYPNALAPVTIFRYNISQNDNCGNIQGSNLVNLSLGGAKFYNNTIYNNWGISIICVYNFTDPAYSNVRYGPPDTIRNNIFYTAGRFPGSTSWDEGHHFYDHNCYANTFTSSTNDLHPITSDPSPINPGTGGYGMNSLGGYKLNINSPCQNAGAAIANNGGHDFWGVGIFNYNGHSNVGAYETPQITPILKLLSN